MKRPLLLSFQAFLASLCLLVLTSCEDKALIQKNEDLRVQIAELEKKVGLLEIEAGEDPGDQSANLKLANEQLAKTLKKLESLDDEKEDLEKQQEALEKKFRDTTVQLRD